MLVTCQAVCTLFKESRLEDITPFQIFKKVTLECLYHVENLKSQQ